MTTTTAPLTDAGPDPAAGSAGRGLKIGFNARIGFPTGHDAEGLRDGVELYRVAEQLGYDTGWVYHRHFDNYLAAPLVFLSVVGQHTSRINLGTALIVLRYEDPILLAEAAATADLLTGGRLQLGLGTGVGGFDRLFGQEPNDGRDESLRRLDGFLHAISGEPLAVIDDPAGAVAVGTELRVTPHSPTLRDRIWYGGISANSATRIGTQGLRLLLGTVLGGEVDDFGAGLAGAIEAYQTAYTGPRPPRVAVARSVLPATTPELARIYADYDEERRTFGPAASRPQGALPPAGQTAASIAAAGPRKHTLSPVFHGDPSAVVDALLADPSIPLSDELILFLPPAFGLRENLRLLEDFVETVAPKLGWQSPA